MAEKYSVTDRTVRNRIEKMSAVLRSGLPAKQEGFLELVNYAHQPDAAAEKAPGKQNSAARHAKLMNLANDNKIGNIFTNHNIENIEILPLAV